MGFLAQESDSLFPQLVSYEKEKDMYKMNYAGFSTVAIKAVQEPQVLIQNQQVHMAQLENQNIDLRQRFEKLEELVSKNNTPITHKLLL
ncbi:MAG: hypothetical protein ABIX01_10775 [Chitinophagaceae bacterium]